MIGKYPITVWARRRVASHQMLQQRPRFSQQTTLLGLVKSAQKTAFGKKHGFEDIITIAEYQECVPLTDFYGLEPWVSGSAHGEPHQSWPGIPRYFGQTSGTTGKAKLIPMTNSLLASNRDAELDLFASLFLECGDMTIFRDPFVALSAKANLGRTPGGATIGFASSILLKTTIPVFRSHVIPDDEVLEIDSWEEKIEAIARQCEGRNIRGTSGVTSMQLAFFRHLQQTGRLKAGRPVTDIWPKLTFFIHAGVQWDSCREQVRNHIGKNVIVRDFYGATEGFMGLQLHSDDPGMTPLLKNIFFEFVPMSRDGRPSKERLLLSQVETGVNYAIAVTTPGGLWSYLIGDTVRFSSVKPFFYRVSGRIAEIVSIVGEKVNSREASRSIRQVAEDLGLPMPLFLLAPGPANPKEDAPCHEWILEFPSLRETPSALREMLDRSLMENSPATKEFRSIGALGPPGVTTVPVGTFARWETARSTVPGQGKLPLLVNSRASAEQLLALADH